MSRKHWRGCILAPAVLLAGIVLSAGEADGLILLPPNATQIRFDSIMAFETSRDPFIDVTTGLPTSPQPADGPLMLTAFGEVHTISDSTDSGNQGSISGELTFSYTGASLSPIAPPLLLSSTPTSRQYGVISTVSGGTLSLYDDPLTGGTVDLNTASFFNGGITVPAAATDGTLYLQSPTPLDAIAQIILTFTRPNALANFNGYNIQLQILNAGTFPVLSGTILGDVPAIVGENVLASQLGPRSESFGTELVAAVLRNASVNSMIEGTFEMSLIIPEPTTAGLMALGAAMVLRRRR